MTKSFVRTAAAAVVFSTVLAACAGIRPPFPPASPAWHELVIPGKAPTRYRPAEKDGRPAWHAVADRSASLLQRRVDVQPMQLSHVQFSWWVPALIEAADLTQPDRADSPVRVVFAFDGDVDRLPLRTRAMFDLAQTLTGHAPPYATLMYVWSNDLPVGTIVRGARSDRIRKIVIDSGAEHLGAWRTHRRDLIADFSRAFGEEPGPLRGVGMMTDADNTASSAEAWYGEIVLQ